MYIPKSVRHSISQLKKTQTNEMMSHVHIRRINIVNMSILPQFSSVQLLSRVRLFATP